MSESPDRSTWRAVASAVGVVLLLVIAFVWLRDVDPIEKILAPFLNALGLNG